MKNRCAIAIYLFMCCASHAQDRPLAHMPERLESADQVGAVAEAAVLNWESQNDIKVFSDARQKVEGDFREESADLIAALHTQKAAPQLLETLVENYLFNVRDHAGKAVPADQPRGGMSFVPPQSSLWGIAEITLDDIRRYPVREHVKQFLLQLTKQNDRPLGMLWVMSSPDDLGIEIDGDPAGNTCTKLVIDAGPHKVAVVNRPLPTKVCKEEVVTVTEGQVSEYSCPKAKRCRAWKNH